MINSVGWIENSSLNTLSQPSLIGICHTIEMHVTLILKALLVKRSVEKNQNEKVEDLKSLNEKIFWIKKKDSRKSRRRKSS